VLGGTEVVDTVVALGTRHASVVKGEVRSLAVVGAVVEVDWTGCRRSRRMESRCRRGPFVGLVGHRVLGVVGRNVVAGGENRPVSRRWMCSFLGEDIERGPARKRTSVARRPGVAVGRNTGLGAVGLVWDQTASETAVEEILLDREAGGVETVADIDMGRHRWEDRHL
jgi:hypothetical protein